ncbi:MAG TPA: hypothetical protein VF246_09835 [Acidimicrobiia bacterium]
MILALAILAAITLGGSFGEAGASTVSIESGTFVVDLYVDVNVSAESVVAHLSTGVDDTRVLALVNRGGSRFGIRTELPRKNYMVVFEAIADTPHLSDPVTLADLGAEVDFPGSTVATEEPEEEPRESTRWGWLAVALGAASLSALAFWVLGGRDEDEAAVDTVDLPGGGQGNEAVDSMDGEPRE